MTQIPLVDVIYLSRGVASRRVLPHSEMVDKKTGETRLWNSERNKSKDSEICSIYVGLEE